MAENNQHKDIFKDKEWSGRDLDIKTDIYFGWKDHPEGKTVSVFVEGKEMRILIPLDVKDGDTVKISGKGNYDPGSEQTGDLYVTVHIEGKKVSRKGILLLVALLAAVICVALLWVLREPEGLFAEPTGTEPTAELPTDTNPAATENCIHQWIFTDCTRPSVCGICGESGEDIPGHIWEEATYNHPKTCMVCRITEGEKKVPAAALGIREIISGVTASSVYAGDNLGRHSPEKLYDGKLDTNWTENVAGHGIGEYVIFYFDDIYAVKKLYIYIGSHYSQDVYWQNCRPRTITLTFSDGSTQVIHLADTYEQQIITFDQYYYTDSITLTIDEVYTGTRHQDTVIAELDITAYRP